MMEVLEIWSFAIGVVVIGALFRLGARVVERIWPPKPAVLITFHGDSIEIDGHVYHVRPQKLLSRDQGGNQPQGDSST